LAKRFLETLGNFHHPHLQFNPTTKWYVLIVNGNGLGDYKNFAYVHRPAGHGQAGL